MPATSIYKRVNGRGRLRQRNKECKTERERRLLPLCHQSSETRSLWWIVGRMLQGVVGNGQWKIAQPWRTCMYSLCRLCYFVLLLLQKIYILKIMRAAPETSKKLIKGYSLVLCGFLLNGQIRPQEYLYPAACYKNLSTAEKSNSNFLYTLSTDVPAKCTQSWRWQGSQTMWPLAHPTRATVPPSQPLSPEQCLTLELELFALWSLKRLPLG